MQRIDLVRREITPKEWLKKSPAESDTEIVYSEPGVYCLDGKPVIIYGRFLSYFYSVLRAVQNLNYNQEVRSSDMDRVGDRKMSQAARARQLGESRTFGFRPRVPYNPSANFCGVSSCCEEQPAVHEEICAFGQVLDHYYEKWAPETAAAHWAALRKVRSEWIIPGTRFTSGIVNKNNPLKYHLDRGNLHGVMSCMAVFKNLVEGGNLSIPEFNAKWLLDDHTYFLFDGQSFIHGVTPVKPMNKNGYRYSIVYYALRAMQKCGSPTEELARCRKEKMERERRRV